MSKIAEEIAIYLDELVATACERVCDCPSCEDIADDMESTLVGEIENISLDSIQSIDCTFSDQSTQTDDELPNQLLSAVPPEVLEQVKEYLGLFHFLVQWKIVSKLLKIM